MKIHVNSLTFKTIFFIVIFSILFILFITFVVKDVFTNAYMELEKDKVTLISQNIESPLALNISYNFEEASNELLNTALKNENVLLIEINNYTTKMLSTFTKHKKTKQEYLLNNDLFQTTKLFDPATNEALAEMTIVYSKNSFESYMTAFNKWFFYGVFGFAFAILMLVLFLYKSLSNLKKLDYSLQNFNPDNPQKISLYTNTKDEVASISNSANSMIEKIITFIKTSKELNSQLLQSQEHLKEAQTMAKVGSLEYNFDTDTLTLSDEYYRLLGLNLETQLSLDDFLSFVSKNDFTRVKKHFNESIKNQNDFDIEYMLEFDTMEYLYIRTKGHISTSNNTVLTAISMDITVDINNKKIIEKLAYFDPLTGLANRTLLRDRMMKSVQNALRYDQRLAVIFLDLDHFKLINDTLGHSVGDQLLVYISKLLQEQIREADTLARLGGDEFIIFLPFIQEAKDARSIASKVLNVLQQKHTIGSHELYVTSSIGVATYPEHGSSCDELIRSADTAMYEAKNDGRNKYKVYSKTMGNFIDKQLHLEQDLTQAVKNKTPIEVYYQVKIDAHTKQISGAEALVRWNHPTNGIIYPDDFIYMAESTGLMIELGNIIIEDSIASLNAFNTLGFPEFKIAINLSARQFQDTELIPFIRLMLQKYAIDPKYVEFEITETISMKNMLHTLSILQELKDLGVSIAIDDFGTGHSSLAYLKKFPIDILKIDKSFVMGIIEDNEDKIIAQTIISMAHSLGLKTVAEGVETQEHATMLRDMKCDLLQGYFYSKPIRKNEFIQFLKDYKI